ncbi:exopolygalacturonase-like [Prunus yedoensis var. nudiflora]|uniref:Exopolygalacturonase-like n=1 Tax=Prunus yedoensis var. nudiflora TaxID=2094558 RepID=A0A314V359_PRUYE|nr:exopolygalacturonase-like [Prunus yedoensis var. nudiflora]
MEESQTLTLPRLWPMLGEMLVHQHGQLKLLFHRAHTIREEQFCKVLARLLLMFKFKATSRPHWTANISQSRIVGLVFNTLTGSPYTAVDGQNNCYKNKYCKTTQAVNLRLDFVSNSMIRDITSLDSKNFHINVLGCRNVTFQYVTITAPEDSINTDGIHIGRSFGITIDHTTIGTGDDCISLGDGSQQIIVTNVTCGPGHGISIGSLGKYQSEDPVAGVLVKNCTLTNTQNGLRIKTWPGSPGFDIATHIHFQDIAMVNVGNPVFIDQQYCPYSQCAQKAPSTVQISSVTFANIKGTSATPVAVQLMCSRKLPCQNVWLEDIDINYKGDKGPLTSQCAYVKPQFTRVANPLSCATNPFSLRSRTSHLPSR